MVSINNLVNNILVLQHYRVKPFQFKSVDQFHYGNTKFIYARNKKGFRFFNSYQLIKYLNKLNFGYIVHVYVYSEA